VARLRRPPPGGLIPFSPLASDEDRASALAQRSAAEALSRPDGFPEALDQVPVMLVICANLEVLSATDRDLDRYQLVGGASIYPFVWNILLVARERGLGGVMTTIAPATRAPSATRSPFPDVRRGVGGGPRPSEQSSHQAEAQPVETFTSVDSFDGPRTAPAEHLAPRTRRCPLPGGAVRDGYRAHPSIRSGVRIAVVSPAEWT